MHSLAQSAGRAVPHRTEKDVGGSDGGGGEKRKKKRNDVDPERLRFSPVTA